MSRPCIFFDRDGVVNTGPPDSEYYVLSPERLFIEQGFLDALKVVNDRGYVAVIVTNQKCIHRGLISVEALDGIHQKLWDRIKDEGLALLDLYYCPFDDGHPDRKPAPGMLLRAASEHDLDLSRSWMIGDSERDITAGRAAGCATTILIDAAPEDSLADHKISSIDEMAQILVQHLLDLNIP